MLTAEMLFDLSQYNHRLLFPQDKAVWTALHDLKGYLADLTYPTELYTGINHGLMLQEHLVLYNQRLIAGSDCSISFGDTLKGGLIVEKDQKTLDGASVIMAGAILIGDKISIGKGTLVEGGATLKSPTVLGDCTEVRQGAYVRGNCLIGDRCVVGHTTEVKHSIFLDDAKAGHFAYLGDSILGNNTNLGAGTKCANLRFIPGNVQIIYEKRLIDTGLRKFGAILGDHAQTGCNSVTSPGSIIGKHAVLMPNTTASSGYHPEKRRVR